MQLNKAIIFSLIFGMALLLSACSHSSKKENKIEAIEGGAVQLRLTMDTDFNETIRYFSKSIQKETKAGRKSKKHTEQVEFGVESKVTNVDIEKGRMSLAMKTISKTGVSDLHDYAMPEMGEEIVFELDETARVYSAGSYSPASIFYVPPISLPDDLVKKGDTWSMHAEWLSFGNNAPFEMDVTSVLKDIVRCGDYRCADVEVSGRAGIIGADEKKVRFRSRVNGRYLFILERGSVLWSLMRSEQELIMPHENVEISNCFFSRLEAPKKFKWSAVKSVSCDPTAPVPEELIKAINL